MHPGGRWDSDKPRAHSHPIRFKPILFGDGEPQDRPVYRMSISLLMEDEAGRTVEGSWIGDVVGMDAAKQGHGGLMGRDFLRHFRFRYDGPNGTFELQSDGDRAPEIKAKRAHERHEKKLTRKNRGQGGPPRPPTAT